MCWAQFQVLQIQLKRFSFYEKSMFNMILWEMWLTWYIQNYPLQSSLGGYSNKWTLLKQFRCRCSKQLEDFGLKEMYLMRYNEPQRAAIAN